MKTSNFRVLSLLVLLSTFFSLHIEAQVGIGTTDPNASSMLDIQSDAKGILIPRMLTSDRTAISSPANGLLVFDTDTKSFWFYNVNAWKELVSGSSIVDADGDTKIEVEQSSDEDKIHFSTANAAGDASVERMTIDNSGITEIGTPGTNYTKIEADGSLSYLGSATRWDDMKVPITSTNKDGSKPPAYYWFQDISGGGWGSQGVFAAWFDKNLEEEVYFMVQMPHGWKEGTDIYPHVHWSTKYDMGSTKVQWGLEYTWANVGDDVGVTTMITGNTPIAACLPATAFKHLLTPLPTMSGAGKTLSSMIICRLYRDADAGSADDFGQDAGLFEIDFHYQIDSDGSRDQFTK